MWSGGWSNRSQYETKHLAVAGANDNERERVLNMNLKSYIGSGLLSVAAVTASPALANKTVLIDPAASSVEWRGSKVIGGAHHGTIGIKEGDVKIDGKKLVSGKIVVDMASIVNRDLEDAGYNQKLVGHLKSEDFFDVAKYPTATLTVKSSEANKDGSFKVKGDLTIKGETHPVEFGAKLSPDGKTVEVSLDFDRTIWNIRYGSGKFFKNLGDKMIADKIELKVKLMFSGAVFAAK